MKKLIFILILSACLCLLCSCFAVRYNDASELPQTPSDPPTQVFDPAPKPDTSPDTKPINKPDITPDTEPAPAPTALQYENMKAMWLSQHDSTDIYLDGDTQRDETDFTARMARILDNVKAQGFNTVFLQVRPNADSMYPSAHYPMSAYVVGQLGLQAEYDPVAIIVRLAHERELSIHAWINPMRGMSEDEILSVGQEYAIRRWYDDPELCGRYIVLFSGRWYLNPAYGEVKNLIVAGAEEALSLYDFDGLHMDDYFYPTTSPSFDADAYAEYQAGGGTLDLAGFRKSALNDLVHELHEMTQNSLSGRIFGVSPSGIVDKVVNDQYADVYQWCGTDGYIDYICPQVYFGLEHESLDFINVCKTYQDMIQTESVELIIGMSFGKAFSGDDPWAGSGREEWKNNKDVLLRCLQATLDLEKCGGISVFCYQYFFEPLTGNSIAETTEERENFVPALQEISWN